MAHPGQPRAQRLTGPTRGEIVLPDDVPIVSVDDHAIEPAGVWRDRLPARMRDAGPTLVERDGEECWTYQGNVYVESVTAALAGKDYSEWQGRLPMRFEDILPGCYDPLARLADMDRDGVTAQLMFPNWPGHAGTRFLEGPDRELAMACVRAWNDWILEEWCAVAPDRFIPISIVPLWDPDLCAAEVERVASLGSRGVTFPENPVPRGLPSFHSGHWDPFFAAMEACDMVVCTHFGSSGSVTTTAPDAPFAVTASLLANNAQAELADLIFSPILQRFPESRFALSEGGIGWIPYMLERLDRQWIHHRHHEHLRFDLSPTELFRKHFWGCSITESFGIAVREHIGADKIMLESDYPHGDTSWPDTRRIATELLADVPEDEARRIAFENASELFRFPVRVPN
jgi:predicted TIM-barrel fold metal-dependent hydrolase